jgi:hypothetical protein
MIDPENSVPMEFVLSANDVLEGAIKEDFETVIVFGWKGGVLYSRMSAGKNRLEIMGALEAAKIDWWQAGVVGD